MSWIGLPVKRLLHRLVGHDYRSGHCYEVAYIDGREFRTCLCGEASVVQFAGPGWRMDVR